MANHCNTFNIECPFALASEDAPVPCVGSQEQCNRHREVGISIDPKVKSVLQAISIEWFSLTDDQLKNLHRLLTR